MRNRVYGDSAQIVTIEADGLVLLLSSNCRNHEPVRFRVRAIRAFAFITVRDALARRSFDIRTSAFEVEG